jgi:hypothetical protein
LRLSSKGSCSRFFLASSSCFIISTNDFASIPFVPFFLVGWGGWFCEFICDYGFFILFIFSIASFRFFIKESLSLFSFIDFCDAGIALFDEGACFRAFDPVSDPWEGGLMDLAVDKGVEVV